MRLCDVDLERCQKRINRGKGDKDRVVPFPLVFRELLGMHLLQMYERSTTYVFEDLRTSFAETFNDQRVSLSLEAFPTLHASFWGRAASERKVGKLASRRCSPLNTGYCRRSSRCLTPQRLCVHGATSLLPGPVIFVMGKSGGISLPLLSRCGYTPV